MERRVQLFRCIHCAWNVQLYAHFCYQRASRTSLRKSSLVTTLVAHKKMHARTHVDRESFRSTFANGLHLHGDEETPNALGNVHVRKYKRTERTLNARELPTSHFSIPNLAAELYSILKSGGDGLFCADHREICSMLHPVIYKSSPYFSAPGHS